MRQNRKTWIGILIFAVVVLALWLPRGLALDRFVTPDEPKWLTRSANFFLALAQRDFASTFQKEHPGVTVMWAGTAGFLAKFPSYVTLGPGQQDRPQRFHRYLANIGVDALELLKTGRAIIVAGIVATLGLAFWQATRLIGVLPALMGFLLIAFDPFLIALSRLLHLDGLVSALILLSLLAWLNFLYRGNRWGDLALSAIAAGLSWLTKSPAFFLIPFIGWTCLIEIGRSWRKEKTFPRALLWRVFKAVLLWTGIAVVLFILLFPAMWSDPLHALGQIFGGAASYASEGHDSVTFFNGMVFPSGIPDWRFYPVNYFWRATPPVLLGLALLTIALLLPRKFPLTLEQKLAALHLGLFAFLFTVFMTLGAKKFDRYLLPVFAPLDLLAALGWYAILRINPRDPASSPRHFDWRQAGAITILSAVVLFQAISALRTYPYYFDYYNPLAGGSARAPGVMMIGWGEGLDQAARYLNAKPDAEKLRVASWYPDGPFSYFFEGETLQRDLPVNPAELPQADYLVLYSHQWQRHLPSEEFLAYFDAQTPEKVIYLDGLEYARIYRLP
jgi:hypothetical protein